MKHFFPGAYTTPLSFNVFGTLIY